MNWGRLYNCKKLDTIITAMTYDFNTSVTHLNTSNLPSSQDRARLESALRESAGAENTSRNREHAEKTVGMELRQENVRLTEEIRVRDERQQDYEVRKIVNHD